MIRVASPIAEPATFDAECRQRGQTWLAANPYPTGRPADYWSPFREDLREGFGRRCGYFAMFLPTGTGHIDHFLSWDTCRKTNRAHLAYEWNNFRFIAPTLNSKKGTKDDQLLDPFEVQDDWFEVDIPSFVLRITSAIPAALRDKAKFTLGCEGLDLQQGRAAIRMRREWYEMHRTGELTIEGLRRNAPLVARAVEKWTQANKGALPAVA
jgi:hypothetical protein